MTVFIIVPLVTSCCVHVGKMKQMKKRSAAREQQMAWLNTQSRTLVKVQFPGRLFTEFSLDRSESIDW